MTETTTTIATILSSITDSMSTSVPQIMTAVGAAAAAGITIALVFVGIRAVIRGFKSVAK